MIIPILTRQFLVTDSVIEMEIANNELFQRINVDTKETQMWKSIDYSMEMVIVFFDFLIASGIIIGLLKAYAIEYKSSQVLQMISIAYLIILLGYLMKILFFLTMDNFSIEHFENYQMLSLADFYSFESTAQINYMLLSGYNLFRLSALVYIVYSIYKLTKMNLKISLILAGLLGSIFFLLPLIGL
jgi:hypothetical protein